MGQRRDRSRYGSVRHRVGAALVVQDGFEGLSQSQGASDNGRLWWQQWETSPIMERRMFCHVTENWRGKPLVSRAVIVSLIGHTKTRTGLHIKAELDKGRYPI